MSKLVALILACALAFTCTAAFAETADAPEVVDLTLGRVTVYDFDGLKLHAYWFNDALTDVCYLIEAEEGVVMLEAGGFVENLAEWKAHIEGLGKPIAGALMAYHPNGVDTFGDFPVYATENAVASWSEGGSAYTMTQGFVESFGEGVAASFPADVEVVAAGDTVNIAGVDFVIREEGDDGYGVEIPAMNAVYIHMLGSDCHSILSSADQIRAFAEELSAFNFDLILTSHHQIETSDAAAEKIAYLEKALELTESCENAESFIAAMNEAFPDYEGASFLAMSAGALFQ